MRIGLYFGTYNPIHVGHLVIANYMAEHPDLDQVWLVVSPQNPLKDRSSLLKDFHRLALVKEGIENNPKLKSCDIEFALPKPSYTITTLTHLQQKYPNDEFALIMGEDNLRTFHKWYNYEKILKYHKIFVYPRALTIQEQEEKDSGNTKMRMDQQIMEHKNILYCADAPVMKVSSSYIRKCIAEGKDVQYLLTEPVFKYVTEMHFYKG